MIKEASGTGSQSRGLEPRNPGLEAIRGLAAVVVMLNHMPLIPGVREVLGSGVMLLNWGVEAVILFFLLSGTVIRISSDRKPQPTGQFLRARAARLLPLYLIAVSVAVLTMRVAGHAPSAWNVLGNFLFLQTLQDFMFSVLASNLPLWSLSFEVFFYLVFAATIGRHQQALLRIWAAAAVGAMLSQLIGTAEGVLGQLQLVTAYSSIWLLGYYAVDLAAIVRVAPIVAFAWLGLLPMAARVSLGSEYYLAVKHLMVAATVVPLFVVILRKDSFVPKAGSVFAWIVWTVAYLGCGYLLFATSGSLASSKFVYLGMPLVTGMIGAAIVQTGSRLTALAPLALLSGQLSYALYLFHYPVYYSADMLGLTGVFGLAVLTSVAVLVACLAEYSVHPYLRSRLFPLPRGALKKAPE